MDLVTLASRFAGPGETLLGDRFLTSHGGKGATQAVAAARLGAQVSLVGAVGDDAFGEQLCEGLRREGVGLEHVTTVADCASGTASIAVAGGENQIIIVPAANLRVTPDHVERAQADIADADAVLVQMEIPLDTVETTVRLGHRLGTPVILNPAPARPLPANWLKLVTYATPNEHELAILLGAQDHREDTAEDFLALMRRAPCPLVLTHGAEGAWYRQTGEPQHQSSFKVDVIDSTGAGDTFNAALAVFLHEGLPQAVRKACAAAALSVAKLGAQGGMPRVSELDAFLAQQS
jgi:ribokinase